MKGSSGKLEALCWHDKCMEEHLRRVLWGEVFWPEETRLTSIHHNNTPPHTHTWILNGSTACCNNIQSVKIWSLWCVSSAKKKDGEKDDFLKGSQT